MLIKAGAGNKKKRRFNFFKKIFHVWKANDTGRGDL
jgi:hypothetical protein